MTLIIASSGLFIGLVLAIVRFTRHFAAPQATSVTAEWIAELTIDATNLLRLLDEGQFQFFRTQPDFTSKLATKFRVERCQLLREHLRHLENDFKLVCEALKVIIVESRQDRPDLASLLLRNQITFAYRMVRVRFRLMCFRWGMGPLTHQ